MDHANASFGHNPISHAGFFRGLTSLWHPTPPLPPGSQAEKLRRVETTWSPRLQDLGIAQAPPSRPELRAVFHRTSTAGTFGRSLVPSASVLCPPPSSRSRCG